MPFLVVLALAIALLAVLFALQNTAPVAISFFAWSAQEPLALVLLSTLAAGVIIGLLISVPSIIKRNLKLSHRRRELEELGWQFQEKDQEIAIYRQETESMRLKQSELLTALAVTEPRTGLLKEEFAPHGINYLLQRLTDPTDPTAAQRGRSVSVFLIDTHPSDSLNGSASVHQEQVLQAIVQRLHHTRPADSWLYHNGYGHFVLTASGLNYKTASEVGEALRRALSAHPIALDNGTAVPITVNIGGAIAQASTLGTRSLLQQAEAALESAKRGGHNRFHLADSRM
jgi:diguanylate cyclase (GGDEF)-like protein